MRTKTPVQAKTPFVIDPHPLTGATTSRAGLSAGSRVIRSLALPGQIAANLPLRQRQRGYDPACLVEPLILLHLAGGDCMEDIQMLREDVGITKILGYQVPSPRCVGDFLDAFHDQNLIRKAQADATKQGYLAFIPSPTPLLEGLGRVLQGNIRAIGQRNPNLTTATIDQDATIIESQKHTAQWTYEKMQGYQPMLAVWSEADLIAADEFRDGNVPAMMSPLKCAQTAFAALPKQVKEFYFRGDSACHEADLVNWLRDERRPDGPAGHIGFGISARMSEDLSKAVRAVREKEWRTFEKELDGTLRQWAEVDFVPGEKSEHKHTRPLRYIGLRLLKPQGELFADGRDRQFHALLTNREGDGAFLLNWHREKAGTVERVHDEVKNGLGGGRLPSAKFGANAAWFRIACLAYNVMSTMRRAWPDEEIRHAKAKRLRFKIFHVTGRVVRDRRKIRLRMVATVAWIQNLMKLFDRFPLLTQPTG